MKQIDIFYADDDEDDLMFFSEAFEKISNNSENRIFLHLHKNGENLIENLTKSDTSAIVLLDINMPFKSGFELLEEIRQNPQTESLPVIMYSTSSNKDYIDKGKSLGADSYVIKPYEFGKLFSLISAIIQIDWNNLQNETNYFPYQY